MINEINEDRNTGNVESIEPLKGLNRREDNSTQKYINLPSFKQNIAHYRAEQAVNTNQFIDMGDYGASHYDKRIQNVGQLQNLQDARGTIQPWTHQIVNGVLKAGVLAGTTFASGTAGLLDGMFNFGKQESAGNIHSAGDALNAFVENPLDLWLNKVNTDMESILPNYRTTAEQNTPWWQRLATANLIGDDFLKMVGFTLGAVYSGGIYAKALSAISKASKLRKAFEGIAVVTKDGRTLNEAGQVYKAILTGDAAIDGEVITQHLAEQAKQLKNVELGLKLKAGILSAQGEAKLEAIQNTQDWMKLESQKIDDDTMSVKNNLINDVIMSSTKNNPLYTMWYDPNIGKNMPILTEAGKEEYKRRLETADMQGNEAKALTAKKAQEMSNTIFLMNIPLLTFQNIWTYGRFMTGGFKSASQFTKYASRVDPKISFTEALKNGTDVFKANKNLVTKQVLKAISVPIGEGLEEMNQQSIATGAGNKEGSSINEFYGYRMDPDSEKEATNSFNSFIQGMKETYSDPAQWEQFVAGALVSFFGIPSFNRAQVTDKSGKPVYDEQGNPMFKRKLHLESEVLEEIKDVEKIKKEQTDIVSRINTEVQKPEFLNRWQSYIRHLKLEKAKEENLAVNDMFSFKNNDLSQMTSDIEMFQKAGRLDDLYDLIERADGVTINDVEQIKNDAVNPDTGKGAYDGMQDTEILDNYKKHISELKDFVKKYSDVQESIYSLYGKDIDDDIRETMSWQLLTINDVEKRAQNISKETLPAIKKLVQVTNEANIKPENRVTPDALNLFNLASTGTRFSSNFVKRLEETLSELSDNMVSPDYIKESTVVFTKLKNEILSNKVGNKTPEEIDPADANALNYLNMRLLINKSATENAVGSEDFDNITKNLNDLIRLANRRYQFTAQYRNLSTNPQLFTKTVQDELKHRKEVYNKEKVNNIFSEMKETATNKELAALYSQIDNVEQKNNLDELINTNGTDAMKKWHQDTNRKNIVLSSIGQALSKEGLDISKEDSNRILDIINESEFTESNYDDFINHISTLVSESTLSPNIKLSILSSVGKAVVASSNTSTPDNSTTAIVEKKKKSKEVNEKVKETKLVEEKPEENKKKLKDSKEEESRDTELIEAGTLNNIEAEKAIALANSENPQLSETLVPTEEMFGNGKDISMEGVGKGTPVISAESTSATPVQPISDEMKNSLLGVAVTQYNIKESKTGSMVTAEYPTEYQKTIQQYLTETGAYDFLKYNGIDRVRDKEGKIKVYLGTMPYTGKNIPLSNKAINPKTNELEKTVAYSTALLVQLDTNSLLYKQLYSNENHPLDSATLYNIEDKKYQVIGVLSNANHEKDNKYDYIYGYYIKGTYSNNRNKNSLEQKITHKNNALSGNFNKVTDNANTLYLYQNDDDSVANTYITEGTIKAGVTRSNIEEPVSLVTPLTEYIKTHEKGTYGFALKTKDRVLVAAPVGASVTNFELKLASVINTPGTMYFWATGNDNKVYPYLIKPTKLSGSNIVNGKETNLAYKYVKNVVNNVFTESDADTRFYLINSLTHYINAPRAEYRIDKSGNKILRIGEKDCSDVDSVMNVLSDYYCNLSISNCQYGKIINNSDDPRADWFNAVYDSNLIKTIFTSFERENSSFNVDAPALTSVTEMGRFENTVTPIKPVTKDESKPTSLGAAYTNISIPSIDNSYIQYSVDQADNNPNDVKVKVLFKGKEHTRVISNYKTIASSLVTMINSGIKLNNINSIISTNSNIKDKTTKQTKKILIAKVGNDFYGVLDNDNTVYVNNDISKFASIPEIVPETNFKETVSKETKPDNIMIKKENNTDDIDINTLLNKTKKGSGQNKAPRSAREVRHTTLEEDTIDYETTCGKK